MLLMMRQRFAYALPRDPFESVEMLVCRLGALQNRDTKEKRPLSFSFPCLFFNVRNVFSSVWSRTVSFVRCDTVVVINVFPLVMQIF